MPAGYSQPTRQRVLDVPAGGETQLSDEIDESKTEEKRVARTEQFSLRTVRELQALLRHASDLKLKFQRRA